MQADGEDRPLTLGALLGVVFDLDGTLVTSGHDFGRIRRSVIAIAEKHGVTPGHLSVTETVPRTMEKAIAELALGGVAERDRYRFEAEVNDVIDAIELEALPRTVARAGASRLLKGLTDKGYRLGILTRSSERFCRSALAKTGLLDFFPDLRTRSSPGPSKPSPEALLSLLKQMGVAPDRALFIGDHPLDAECATRAWVRFLAVLAEDGPPDLAERLQASGAIVVARDLTGLARILGVPVGSAPAIPSR